jgi:hypothetical protein
MTGKTCGGARVGNNSVHYSRAWPRREHGIKIPLACPASDISRVKHGIDRLTCAGQTHAAGCFAQRGGDDVVPVVQPAATYAFARHGMRGFIAG